MTSLQSFRHHIHNRISYSHITRAIHSVAMCSTDNPSPPPIIKLQRALGVDYGRKFVGLAVSTLGFAPRPLKPIPGRGYEAIMQLADDVVQTALAEGCDGIVIGLPVTTTGSLRRRQSDSQQGRRCRNFAEAVSVVAADKRLHVFLVDERGTTMEAEALVSALGGRAGDVKKKKDSVAAALILSAYFSDSDNAVRVPVPKIIKVRRNDDDDNDDNSGSGGSGVNNNIQQQ